MDFIIAVGATLAAKVVEHTFLAVHQIRRYTRNVENLRSKIEELGNTKDELQGRADQATQDRDIIKEDVLKYITDADRLSREAETFLETDCERAVIRCFGGSLPNLVSRRRLSKQAKEKADELLRAIQAAAGDGFLVVTSRPALHSCIADRGGYADFETREKILEEIMAALSNSEVRKVGVYGMGGVGKTMLAKEVARRATEEKLFSEVVFSTVSQTMDLKAIQQVVADKIELKFGATESVYGRADRLKRRLTEERKILIILDDIWDRLNLEEVGLNFDNDQKGCKILMTSRSLFVTRNSMGAEINIMVRHLSHLEARNLFTTVVGTNVVDQQDFKTLTDAVVGECRGLPLAIMTVASALKDNDELSDWKDALFQLQNSDPTNIPGMLKDVYPSIRLSFDYLESEEAKNLLLLCSLYGEDVDIEVDELMMLSLGRGFLQNVHSVAAARRRVDSLVRKLKDRCLLLDGFNCDWVKMHDVIRDVAIAIASEDSWAMHSFTINDTLEDCLSEKSFKDTKALSLLRNSNSIQPPERELECPQLELFLISRHNFYSGNYLQIPIINFLNESTHLKVLSLYRAHFFFKFPTSLKFLQNLKTLRLHMCKLDDIDYIGDLINLTVLDLRSSTFQQLPSKIGELTRLQLLNLEYCDDLKVIRENVISSLTRLEELYMPANFWNWDAGEVATDRRNANVAELMNLQKLTTLFLSIPDAKILPKGFVFSEKLERYRIGIGIEYNKFYREGLSRSLVLRDCEESLLMAHGLEALMRSSEGLKLGGLAGGIIKNNVVYDPDKDGFPKLKILELSDCDEVQYVVDALEQKSTIHPSKLTADSFKQLREVEVRNCGRLKNLFPLSIAKRLHRIKVIDCKSVEEIVEHDDQLREDEAAFDELLSLHLQSLPKLVQFICWPQLGVTTVSSSVESANYHLFHEKVALPKLRTLDLSGIHVKKLWADQLPSTSIHMQYLSELYVKNCNELEYLSSVDVAKSLVKLQAVMIKECRSLELIFLVTKKQGGEEDGTSLSEKLSLPQLQTLHLSDLPNLKMLCATLDKKNAQLGEQEPLFSGMVAFPKLETLTLSKIVVNKLWADQHSLTSNYMQSLSDLHIHQCDNVKYLSSFCVAKSLVRLKIYFCRSLEVIFLVSKKQVGDEGRTSSPEKPSLSQLKTLKIDGLPNLKTLCATVDKEIMQRDEQEPFVNGMIELSGLHELKLSVLNIERLWPDFDRKLLATTSYMENLTSLTVSKCNKLKYLISFAMAERLVKLKELEVTCCSEMECIVIVRKRFDGEDQRSSKQILFPKLTSIQLSGLSGLKSFCQGADDCIQLPALLKLRIRACPELKIFVDKQGENELATKSFFHEKMIIFPRLESLRLERINITKLWEDHRHSVLTCMPNLKELSVADCDNLKYLFSSTVCTSPFPLERLSIEWCMGMEEVVAITEEPRSKAMSALSVSLLFSKLEFLFLYDLPKLKQFCKGDIVEFPLLSELRIRECSELRAFIVDSTANEKQLEEMDKQPLFSHKVIFPCLRHVETDWKEAIDEIFGPSQFPSKELKELHVKCPTHDEPISLSIIEILHRYPNLETLNLSGSFVNIKTCQHDDQDERILAQSLARPLMSFHNLTELEVSECHELTYLLDSSVARSLAQLKAMSIRSCGKMRDIIRDCEEGETTEDEAFDFKRLEILVLYDLPTLKSFYSGNNAMMFPKLEKLFLSQCPEMKSFSHGIMTASLLVTIITGTEDKSWNGDVNTTIRKLWEESSNSSSQQPSAVTVVDDCSGEGTSTKGAGM